MTISKLGNGSTRRILAATLMLLLTGCANGSSNQSGVCDGTLSLRDTHAEGLIEDGGDKSLVTGAALIAALDAACDEG